MGSSRSDTGDSSPIKRAAKRLLPHVLNTPLKRSDALSRWFGDSIYLKLENLQRSGSFKIRGATNAILKHEERAREHGVITASAGNHAQGVAFAADLIGCRARIVMPENTPDNKVMATRDLGAEVILSGENYDEAYEEVLRRSAEGDQLIIHPYDDPDVIAGQGTVGREIERAGAELDWLIVPVGGGGLLAGITTWMKEHKPELRLFPAQCEEASSLEKAREMGKPERIVPPTTIAEGIATGEVGETSFEMIKNAVEPTLLVDDDEIIVALKDLLEFDKVAAEGAGAVPLAALRRYRERLPDGPGGLLISGGNLDVLETIHFLERGLRSDGRLIRLATELTDRPGALSDLAELIGRKGGNIQFIHHDRSDLGVGARRAKVHIEVSVRSRQDGQRLLESLRKEGYTIDLLEI